MKTQSLAVATALFVVTALCSSCSEKGDHSIYLRDSVNSVKELTLPSDAAVTGDSGLLQKTYSAAAHWEFETHGDGKAYLSWVGERLERVNFKLQSSDESSLLFIRTSQDETENIKIQVMPFNRGLRVYIALAIDSD